MPPFNRERIKDWTVVVEKGVREILEEHGVDGKSIDTIIWSHHHWDHTGAAATFDPQTSLVVGPGFIKCHLPGYPTNPNAALLDADIEGREIREISFDDGLMIGNFRAHDFFW